MRASLTTAVAAVALVAVSACGAQDQPANGPAAGVPGAGRGAALSAASNPPLPDHTLFAGAPGRNGSGAVEVRVEGNATPQTLVPPTPQPGERFGAAVLYSQLDTTYQRFFALVGSPGLTVAGKVDAGGVHVFERTSSGWRHLDLLTQDHPGIPGQAQAGAQFGSAFEVTAGEDHEPATVFVGAPGLDVNGVRRAGGVFYLDLTHYVGGEDINGSLLTLAGTSRAPMAGDRLGAVLAEGFAGAPGATVNGQRGAGLAVRLPWPQPADLSELKIFHQGKDGVQGAPEAGDAFGSSFATSYRDGKRSTWIGVPGEDVGTVTDAGMVNSVVRTEESGEFEWSGGPAYTQNTADDGSGKPVEGVAESGDRFGSAMAGYSENESGRPYLYVGTPGEDIGSVADAGSVTGLLGARSQSQDTVGGRPRAGERFGATVYNMDISIEGSELLIGAPGAAGGAGLVAHGIHREGATSITWDRWTLPGGQPTDRYGSGVVSHLPFF